MPIKSNYIIKSKQHFKQIQDLKSDNQGKVILIFPSLFLVPRTKYGSLLLWKNYSTAVNLNGDHREKFLSHTGHTGLWSLRELQGSKAEMRDIVQHTTVAQVVHQWQLYNTELKRKTSHYIQAIVSHRVCGNRVMPSELAVWSMRTDTRERKIYFSTQHWSQTESHRNRTMARQQQS